ncbi:hypothetical protein BD779DRAFT_1677916 [Infundibulicybe gibba]|nr:hypothetical protein BD779DRAFT_1677916 [Infundibulicybe gibba]
MAISTPQMLPPSNSFLPADVVRNLWATNVPDTFGSLIAATALHTAFGAYDLVKLIYADLHIVRAFLRGPIAADRSPRGNSHLLMLQPQHGWSMYIKLCVKKPTFSLFKHIAHPRLRGLVKLRTQLRVSHMDRLTHSQCPAECLIWRNLRPMYFR